MPVEKSGQNEFDFQYGDDFGAHIEHFDPDFSKVLVRYNPDGDAEMNRRQLERLKRLADWLHEHDRKFLFELLVPAEEAELTPRSTATQRSVRPSRCGLSSWSPRSALQDTGRGRRLEDRGRRRAAGTARAAGSLSRGGTAATASAASSPAGALDDDKVDLYSVLARPPPPSRALPWASPSGVPYMGREALTGAFNDL